MYFRARSLGDRTWCARGMHLGPHRRAPYMWTAARRTVDLQCDMPLDVSADTSRHANGRCTRWSNQAQHSESRYLRAWFSLRKRRLQAPLAPNRTRMTVQSLDIGQGRSVRTSRRSSCSVLVRCRTPSGFGQVWVKHLSSRHRPLQLPTMHSYWQQLFRPC